MEIIAISVCVNYHDILYHNIDQNIKFISKWYIITSPDDVLTQKLIKEKNISNIELIIYNNFYNNCKFNKGGAIRQVQDYIDLHYNESNILLLDSDIYLPNNFSEKLPNILQNDTIYGVSERIDYWKLTDFNNNINPHKYKCSKNFVGFFQLYKQNSKYKYENSYNCAKCDDSFKDKFYKKINLDLIVKHLGKDGINWNGRIGKI
jgi:hypothetical protein